MAAKKSSRNTNPMFKVSSRNDDGSLSERKYVAHDRGVVEDLLTKEGVTWLDISELDNTGLNKEISFGFGGRIKTKHIAQWARQFSTMIDSGLPIVRALKVLGEQTENKKLAKMTDEIKSSVESGLSLGEAMEQYVETFGDLVVNMVKAGEIGGFLDNTFRQIAKSLDADVRLRSKVKSAMTYPVVVLVMALVMSAGMLLFIVPVFANMFASMGGQLPLPTRIMVTLSNTMKNVFITIPIIVIVIMSVTWWRKNKRKQSVRDFIDPIKLKIPIMGTLIKKIILARFARNFSTLLSSGVPILRGLDVVSGTVGNVIIERALSEVKLSVAQGESISEPLSRYEVFPPMVVQMVTVGEEGGNVDKMLEKIADDYDLQVETMTEQLASLIEPLMIAFLGVVIGSMVIALYLPIFSIYDLIQK